MLCQFTFKNYKSYRDETIFDMQAANIDEFDESLITFKKDNRELLPISVIYGPNGGGKSNLLKALVALISTVLKPKLLFKNQGNFMIDFQKLDYINPFVLDDKSKTQPTEFEIYFRTSDSEYKYILNILKGVIVEEHLYKLLIGGKKPSMLFERYKNDIELGASLKKLKISTDVNKEMPYLSFLSITHDIEVISKAMKWFEKCIVVDYGNPIGELLSKAFINKNEEFKDGKSQFINMMRNMDINISDYRIDERMADNQVYVKHLVNGREFELLLDEESQGTCKIFGLIPQLIIALRQGSLIIIDELDAKLHPKLLRYIIKTFTDNNINTKGAQLLFTSHDLTTMKSNFFRRDEIWFAAKDNNESSQIYSLYDIRDEKNDHIRVTAAYDKQYLEGRYGADPYLRQMINWEDMNE